MKPGDQLGEKRTDGLLQTHSWTAGKAKAAEANSMKTMK